jgi:predicted dinucleotide-binding enzyme
MRIGIIGSGHIGSTLARLFVKAGHEIGIRHAHDPATLEGFVNQLGDKGCTCTPEEAADFGEIVVVAIPFGNYRELPAEKLAGKIVIDTNNYYPDRDGHIPELDSDKLTSSELLQRHLPKARIVKAFNTIRWDHLLEHGEAAISSRRHIGIPIAGDDVQAKRKVAELIEGMGFEAVDTGGLADGGRRQQPGSNIYLAELPGSELRQRIASVSP